MYYFCGKIEIASQDMTRGEATESRKFAIIGVAGYIAPRHLNAMRSLKCELVAAHDVFDSVGMIDGYFPRARFTTDANDFKKHMAAGHAEYLTVCTPNYLHCTHTIMGLEAGLDVICEKPLALTPDELRRMEACRQAAGRHISPILQLRLHPEIERLKRMVDNDPPPTIYDIDLTYITPRGSWYAASWKGDSLKSGGVVANIGIHFIDMLHWIFGPAEKVVLHRSAPDCSAGFLQLKRARVRYFLSVNADHRPVSGEKPMSPYRHLIVNGEKFDFTNGFTDLHTLSYERILAGKGFSVDDAMCAIHTLENIRKAAVSGLTGDYHPLLRNL